MTTPDSLVVEVMVKQEGIVLMLAARE